MVTQVHKIVPVTDKDGADVPVQQLQLNLTPARRPLPVCILEKWFWAVDVGDMLLKVKLEQQLLAVLGEHIRPPLAVMVMVLVLAAVFHGEIFVCKMVDK